MKFGLFSINMGSCADPETAAAVARAAEDAGFDSLWAGEHVVLPDPQAPPSPAPPQTPIVDPVIALTYLAAVTRKVRLGTGIIILPQRNPLVLGKELASLDVLSKGRLSFGIGIGYLKPEFDAIGVPFDRKGARTEESLKAMLALWTMPKPEYRGQFFSFGGIDAHPRPVQKPFPQIVFGGHTPEAFSRTARLAQGWYGFALDSKATAKCLEGLRKACSDSGKRFDALEISVTPVTGGKLVSSSPPAADQAKAFADLGVHRLIVYPPAGTADKSALLRYVDEVAKNLIGKV
ncbi:MAG TPA: LLM class F420-dependent oxidoreductase [Candidatus Binataceae bacterium]